MRMRGGVGVGVKGGGQDGDLQALPLSPAWLAAGLSPPRPHYWARRAKARGALVPREQATCSV